MWTFLERQIIETHGVKKFKFNFVLIDDAKIYLQFILANNVLVVFYKTLKFENLNSSFAFRLIALFVLLTFRNNYYRSNIRIVLNEERNSKISIFKT